MKLATKKFQYFSLSSLALTLFKAQAEQYYYYDEYESYGGDYYSFENANITLASGLDVDIPIDMVQIDPQDAQIEPNNGSAGSLLVTDAFTGSVPSFDGGTDKIHTYGQTCGMLDPTGNLRIVNGSNGDISRVPWQVRLLLCFNDGAACYVCGGSIISENYVLTAAHCVYKSDPISHVFAYIKPGSSVVEFNEVNYRRQADGVIIHDDYNDGNLQNDIALLRFVNDPFVFESDIFPVCLPKTDMCLTDRARLLVTGYGATQFQGSAGSQLREVELPLTKWSDCNWRYSTEWGTQFPVVSITFSQICAGGRLQPGDTLYKSPCQGDSGGPLNFYDANDIGTVMGVVSWGIACDGPGFPSVYARTSAYVDWIFANSRVRMDGDSLNTNAVNFGLDSCFDDYTQENGGYADLTNTQDTSQDPVYAQVSIDTDKKIPVKDIVTACLVRDQRNTELDYRPGKFLAIDRDCYNQHILYQNNNYQFSYDETTGRIYNEMMAPDNYCVFRSHRNAYITKCEHAHIPGVRTRQQFDFLPTSGAIVGRTREKGIFRGLYYVPSLVTVSSDFKVRVGAYRFSHFNSLNSGAVTPFSLVSDSNDKLFGDQYCLSPSGLNYGDRIKTSLCSGFSANAGWQLDSVTERISWSNGSDSINQYCLYGQDAAGPVTVTECSNAGTTAVYDLKYFTWRYNDHQIYMIDPSNPSEEKMCLYVDQRRRQLYLEDCSLRNFRFGV